MEYDGKVPPEEVEPLRARLQAEVDAALRAGGAVRAAVLPYAEAAAACGGALPPYIKEGTSPRVVVLVPDTAGCPCGGTHVSEVAHIGALRVSGIRVKKGVTRVSYTVEEGAA